MAMELRHLRYFVAVAEEEHITRAAERLGMQQPPLSQQIRAIERELDVQLFRRKPRGVELTDAGRALLAEARSILSHIDRALEVTRRTARGEQGRISVGYTDGAALHPLVPRVIREFREAFPLVTVTMAGGFPYDLIERMRNDQIDVAFIRTAVADMKGLIVERLLEEAMVVALPSGHGLAQSKSDKTSLSLKALAGETLILYGSAQSALTMHSDALVLACRAAGFTPHVGHVVSNNLSRLNFIAAGLGVAVVAASFQRLNIDGVVYRHLKGLTQPKAPLNLASRRGDASAVVRQFLRMAKQSAKTYCADAIIARE
jgi:DNA-binding transcriptional LysR family regulator